MLFTDFLAGLPAPSQTVAESRALRGTEDRDLLATTRGRTTATRNVESVEGQLGKQLDLPASKWPEVVRTLGAFGASDWSSLRTSGETALGIEPLPKNKAHGKNKPTE